MKCTLQVLNDLEHAGVLRSDALAGAMAATFYVEPLLTFDLDVFVTLPTAGDTIISLAPVYEALRAGLLGRRGMRVNRRRAGSVSPAYNALVEEASNSRAISH